MTKTATKGPATTKTPAKPRRPRRPRHRPPVEGVGFMQDCGEIGRRRRRTKLDMDHVRAGQAVTGVTLDRLFDVTPHPYDPRYHHHRGGTTMAGSNGHVVEIRRQDVVDLARREAGAHGLTLDEFVEAGRSDDLVDDSLRDLWLMVGPIIDR